MSAAERGSGAAGLGGLDEARRALVEEAQLEVVPYTITAGYPHLSVDQVLKVHARSDCTWYHPVVLSASRHM